MNIRVKECELVVMGVQEYANRFDCCVEDMLDVYGRKLKYIAWLEKRNARGELVAMSMEIMFIYKNLTFGYTARGLVQKSSLREAFECIKWIEEV